MNKKRIFAHIGTGVAALLVAFGMEAASAKAENLAGTATVKVNYDTQTLAITGLGMDDKEVMVNFPAVTTNRDGDVTKVKEKEWDVYQVPKAEDMAARPKVTVDISTLNPAKRSYVIVKSLKCKEPVLICIEPIIPKVTGKYDAESKTVSFVAGEEEMSQDEFQYRTSYGSWEDYSEDVTLEMYEQQGATIYFRQAPGIVEQVKNPKSNGIRYGTGEGTYVEYDTRYTFGGKELKVKITRLKTAPKVSKVDLDNQAYVLKQGLEYRFTISGDEEWIQVSEPAVVRLAVELDDGYIYYPGQFEVRSQAVEAGDRTPYISPSKIMIYEYPGLRTITTVPQKAGSLLEDMPVDEDDVKRQELKVKKVTDSKGKVTGIEFENVSECDYQIVVSVGERVDEKSITSDTRLKPKNLKAKGRLKLSSSKTVCPEGSYIYVRYAANKATGDWASDYVCLGELTFGE